MLKTFSVNLTSNSFYKKYYGLEESGKSKEAIQTRALAFCLVAAGMERLFTRDDFRELVFRLTVIFQQLNILENFFRDNYLFDFFFEDEHFRITHNDLLAHLGIHIFEYPAESMPREVWYQKMQDCWEGSVWTGILGETINPVPSLVLDKINKQNTSINIKSLNVNPSPELILNAEILAENVMKELPVKPFEQFRSENREFLQTINRYIDYCKSPLPIQYDWNKITEENQQAILKHVVEPQFYFDGMTMDDVINEYADWVPDLVYLAWIKANGFADDLYHDKIDPRVDIDPSKYEELGVEGGINLGLTYDAFDLSAIEKYLIQENRRNNSNK